MQRILIAPLDWGLGHASRCVPIIHDYIEKGYAVTIAASGPQKKLLQYYFPASTYVSMPGYHIKYSKKAWWLPVALFFQLPKIALAIYREHQWLKAQAHAFDHVISDNRYGLFNSQLTTTFITHQLIVKAPFKWAENLVQKIQYYFINKFSECWVPDIADYPGYAADLSHPKNMPRIPVTYIGSLSQFSILHSATHNAFPIKYKYCFLLSGPEPQRTMLQHLIESDAGKLQDQVILIEGRPSDLPNHYKVQGSLTKLRYASGQDLLDIIMQSEFIVCRSGYSTLMELLPLHKKMILVPTPGQTEQRYLATTLSNQKMAVMISQSNFDVVKMDEKARQHCFIFAP
jgi:UDP-N-acetylglucosamine transferase subunit ALG13